MSVEAEALLLAEFDKKAGRGEVITAKEIKTEHIKRIGHKCGSGQIYRVFVYVKLKPSQKRAVI
jgi:hypothetical protein